MSEPTGKIRHRVAYRLFRSPVLIRQHEVRVEVFDHFYDGQLRTTTVWIDTSPEDILEGRE